MPLISALDVSVAVDPFISPTYVSLAEVKAPAAAKT